MIKFLKYQHSYYQQVCDFLIEINKESSHHMNWNWARWEWMYEHALTRKDLLKHMGLWFDGDHLVGVALMDMYFGEAFIGVLQPYSYLYQEVLNYAFQNLKDEQGLGITIANEATKEIEEAIKQGFDKQEKAEVISEIGLDCDFLVSLPSGFTIEEYDAQTNPLEWEWLMWQGFDNGNNKEEFLKQFKQPTRNRPHFNPSLCVVIRNREGLPVAGACSWYDDRTDYAYLEPVFVIPSYRKKGLGKIVVYTTMNQARKLGAKRMIVNSDQLFYRHLGFIEKYRYFFYWKR